MERLFKYIRETKEKQNELDLEYSAMKSLLETKLQQNIFKSNKPNEDRDDDSAETLKIKLRELEKRRTQQALNYEEALLELEAFKKNNQRQSTDVYRKYDSKDDLEWLLELMSNYSNEKSGINSTVSEIAEKPIQKMENEKFDSRDLSESGIVDGSSTNSDDQVKYMFDRKDDIPAPVQIRIETPANQFGWKLVIWQPPDIGRKSEDYSINSYHIYVDGDFYKAVGVQESPMVSLPDLDNKVHRVSIRSVCSHGQSKDPQCTLIINSTNHQPTNLKANKITGTSASVSWMPSNSNFYHAVWLNGVKFRECHPGVYKILLYGMIADRLQKVKVHPVLDLYPDATTVSAYLDFQTLPVCNEVKSNFPKKSMECDIEEIEPPRDVRIKLGNRPGKFTIYWQCPQQPATSSIRLVGYSMLVNNQCVALVNGAQNHKFSLNLSDLRGISVPINQAFLDLNKDACLSLTMRTLATATETENLTDCTIQSKDSQPAVKLSGAVVTEIAGIDTDVAALLGEPLMNFLRLKSPHLHDDNGNEKSSWHSCYCLNNSEAYDVDSSFLPRSDFDWIENKSTPYRSMSTNVLDQPNHDKSSPFLSGETPLRPESSRPRIDPQLSNDSCSSDSSNNSSSYVHHSSCKSSSPGARHINGQSPRDIEETNQYLVVRHEKTKFPRSSSRERNQEKISVPKIQITKDSSYSDDEEIFSSNHHTKRVPYSGSKFTEPYNARRSSNEFPEHRSSNQVATNPSPVTQSKHSPTSQNDQYSDYDNDTIATSSPDKGHSPRARPQRDLVRYFVTLYDYDPATMSPNRNATNEELPFRARQTITVFGEVDSDGFYTGEINNRRGLVPSNMVQEVDNLDLNDKVKTLDNISNKYSTRSPKSSMGGYSPARPHYDQYNSESRRRSAVNEHARSSFEDDIHYQNQRKSADSVARSTSTIDPNSKRRSKMREPMQRQYSDDCSGPPNKPKRMVALYDYDPQILSPNVDSEAELPFKANDIITILGDLDEDGFYLGERNGQRGLVPSNFLTADIPTPNRLSIQHSFDGAQIRPQYKERKQSAGSNQSDPPLIHENKIRVKQRSGERDLVKPRSVEYDDYSRKSSLGIDQLKESVSFEESFDSGPSTTSSCLQNPELVRAAPFNPNSEHRNSIPPTQRNLNPTDMPYKRPSSSGNESLSATSRPAIGRRDSNSKATHTSALSKQIPIRRQSPPAALEPDDMPIVMDLAPTKEQQKKKKISTTPENFSRLNIIENPDNYGNSGTGYNNPHSSSMSDNLDRKRSVFKNPFKRKK